MRRRLAFPSLLATLVALVAPALTGGGLVRADERTTVDVRVVCVR